MRNGEIGDVVRICRDEIYSELSLPDMEDWLRSDARFPYLQFFVAEKAGEIVGFIGWYLYDRYDDKQLMLELAPIAVKEEYQRSGIGRKLIRESLEEVKTFWGLRGLEIVEFMVETEDDNEKARRFYEAVLISSQKIHVSGVWRKNGKKVGKVFYFVDLREPDAKCEVGA